MSRYLLRQPKSLQKMSLEVFGSWITSHAESTLYVQQYDAPHPAADGRLSQQIEMIQNYLKANLPNLLHDIIASEVIQALQEYYIKQNDSMELQDYWSRERRAFCRPLSSYVTQAKVIGRLIETVFTNNLTRLSLDFDKMPASCPATISAKLFSITSLVQLHFSTTDIDSLQETDVDCIILLLKQSHHLKHLSLRLKYVIRKDLIKCITDNCKLIEELDLKNNFCINDDNVVLLSQLRCLRSVNLENTAVSSLGIATLLLTCDNLEHIETGVKATIHNYYYRGHMSDKLVRAVEHIASFPEHTGKQFKLKYYCNKEEITVEQLRLVIKMCPIIQKICIHEFKFRQMDLVLALNSIQDLRTLELYRYDFDTDQVKELFKMRSCNLVDLTLTEVVRVDLQALMCVFEMCPNLRNLQLRSVYYVDRKSAYDVSKCRTNRMKSLTVDDWYGGNNIAEDQLFFLLSKCPFIEYINLGKSIVLRDKFMLKVLDANPMIYLKKLSMMQSSLTTLTVDRIIQNCINNPEVLIDNIN